MGPRKSRVSPFGGLPPGRTQAARQSKGGVGQTGHKSNLPVSRLGPLMALNIKLKELIAKLHDHAIGQLKKIK